MSMPQPPKFTMAKVNSMLNAMVFSVKQRLGQIFKSANVVLILVNSDNLIQTFQVSKKLLIRTLIRTQIFPRGSPLSTTWVWPKWIQVTIFIWGRHKHALIAKNHGQSWLLHPLIPKWSLLASRQISWCLKPHELRTWPSPTRYLVTSASEGSYRYKVALKGLWT
jgi:hypothetical protein